VAAVRWPIFTLAVVTTLLTLGLLLWALRSRSATAVPARARQDRRRPPQSTLGDPREALALVGNALAATHNPRVLLPVILEVMTEATGARGGQILVAGKEAGWIGEVGGSNRPLSLDVGFATEGDVSLLLFPPPGGFADETRTLAEWLASQAAVALDNARLHEIVQRQAITDDLTGLVNRRRFVEALDAEIERARRFGSPLTVVLADLDNFKQVNDDHGHHAGDDVLRSFAGLLRAHVRDVDVCARIGGEEFAIVLPETDEAGAGSVAERMRESLATVPIAVTEGGPVRVTSSFGVAELGAGQSGDDLLRGADAALYRAKEAGKNRVVS
jgi:diguanylate cyclase (GGDEF)-like protein